MRTTFKMVIHKRNYEHIFRGKKSKIYQIKLIIKSASLMTSMSSLIKYKSWGLLCFKKN